ncbi:hypothetical protein M5689_020258 [Euphorbia peplus]|nr:hypothetical protein M5689_020258 [Euphorbia peplus]
MAETEITQIQEHTKIQIYDESTSGDMRQPKIQKVPKLLREIKHEDGDHYAPMVVSIGPYYYGKEGLMEMEKLKIEFASKYFPGSSEEMYTTEINADVTRKYYLDGSLSDNFASDEKFSKMMFLDGCFILHFISCFLAGKWMGMKPHIVGLVIRDLFLLENQLPFSVLEALIKLSKGYSKKGEECTVEKVKEFINIVRRSPITDEKHSSQPDGKKSTSKCNKLFSKITSLCFRAKTNNDDVIPKQPLHLLELFHTQFTKQNPSRSKYEGPQWYHYRSAKELNNVGIHFKQSKTSIFDDVVYDSHFFYGYLSLPPILVDDLSKSLLLNIAAYESCPDMPDYACQVSSYIVFLNSLIDQAEDVKELRSKGILLNSLGSDQDVANLFNEISKYLVMQSEAYQKVRNGIDQRYEKRTKKWITEWLNEHFSSPWTITAFIGATIGLGLTAIETYKSFSPTFEKIK